MDRLSPTQRRRLMARVKSKGTRPEREIATLLCSLRYHFSSHDASLPGTPDFVLNRHKLAIFVHGCFWHAHSCRRGQSMPTTRRTFWRRKKDTNVARDRRATTALRRLGYRVLVVWECKLTNPPRLALAIRAAVARARR